MTRKTELGATGVRVTYADGKIHMFDAPAKRVDIALTLIQVAAEHPDINPTGVLSNKIEFLDEDEIISTFTRKDVEHWTKVRDRH